MSGTVDISINYLDITFSDISNVIHKKGARHDGTNGSDPISFIDFRSKIVEASTRRVGLLGNQDYKFNYSEGTNKTISNYNNLIVTNVGSPLIFPVDWPRPHLMTHWPTNEDVQGDGSVVASDPLHAWLPIPDTDISGAGYDWMSGNNSTDPDHRYSFSFMLLHNSTKSTLNIDWKRSSDHTGGDNFYVFELPTNSGDNYKNPGAPGLYTFPTTTSGEFGFRTDYSGFSNSGDNGGAEVGVPPFPSVESFLCGGIVTTTADYIALFYFKSNPTQNYAEYVDDRTYIRVRGGETGLVPYNFVDPPIFLSTDISLNSLTDGNMYAPTKTIKFGCHLVSTVNGPRLPDYDAFGTDDPAGTITFDAGINNTWRLELGNFDFPNSSGGFNMEGQLSIKAGDTKGNYDKVKINGLINTNGNRSDEATGNPDKWFTPGEIIYDSADQSAQQYRSSKVSKVTISNYANNPAFVDSIALGAAVSQDTPYFRGTLAEAIPAGFTGTSIYILSQTISFEISTDADLSFNTNVLGSNSVTIPASEITASSPNIYYTGNGYVLPSNNTLSISTFYSISDSYYGETGFNTNSYAEWTLNISSTSIPYVIPAGDIVTQQQSGGKTVTGWLKNTLSPPSITGLVISTSISGIDVHLDTFVPDFDIVIGSFTIPAVDIISAAYDMTGKGYNFYNSIININKRYLEFTYNHNVGNINYVVTPAKGWLITLQRRIRDLDKNYNGEYIGQSININRDFRTRIKNHNPILKITETKENGLDSSGNTSTNKNVETINLRLDVSGSRPSTRFPSRISSHVLYDLSLNDITASNNTVDISSAFSGMDGSSSFILASIGSVGLLAQTITVDVSANTFRNEYGNWNDVSGGDFDKFTWNYADITGPLLVITSDNVSNNGPTSTSPITIKFTFSEPITESERDQLLTNSTLFSLVNGTFDGASSPGSAPLTGVTQIEDRRVFTVDFSPTGSDCSIGVAGEFTDSTGNKTIYTPGDISFNFTFQTTPTEIEINFGSTYISYAPFYGYYDFSQFGVIYTVDEMTNAATAAGISLTNGCTISSLFFQYEGWIGYDGSTRNQANNQTVKIANIPASTTYIEAGQYTGDSTPEPNYNDLGPATYPATYSPPFTTVKSNFIFFYDGKEQSTWEEIGADPTDSPNTSPGRGFDNPFVWDGSSNILISWENRDGSYTDNGDEGAAIGGTGTTTNGVTTVGHDRRAHAWRKDYSYPTSGSTYNRAPPNIRLIVLPT